MSNDIRYQEINIYSYPNYETILSLEQKNTEVYYKAIDTGNLYVFDGIKLIEMICCGVYFVPSYCS